MPSQYYISLLIIIYQFFILINFLFLLIFTCLYFLWPYILMPMPTYTCIYMPNILIPFFFLSSAYFFLMPLLQQSLVCVYASVCICICRDKVSIIKRSNICITWNKVEAYFSFITMVGSSKRLASQGHQSQIHYIVLFWSLLRFFHCLQD